MTCTHSRIDTHSRYQTIFSLALLLPCLTWMGLPAQAVTANRALVQRSTIASPYQVSFDFKVPRRGAPRSTAGGASRGSCPPTEPIGTEKLRKPLLTSLLPNTRLGLTFAEHPSFFVYVPQSSAKTASFLLLSDDDAEVVYETTFALPSTAGIVRFNLPQDAPVVEVGKQYHWSITTLCNVTSGFGSSPSVEGWLERSTPNEALTKALQKTLPGNRPNLYAAAGIWHETLATLADLQQQYPQDARFAKDWRDVLQSVGLEAVAAAPLIDCCTVKP